MSILTPVHQRRLQPEIMDEPDLEQDRHAYALRSLARINWISRSPHIVWPPIAALARRLNHPVRVLDIASGGGDIACKVATWAKAAGLTVAIDGVDISPVANEIARKRAEKDDLPVTFRTHDVIKHGVPEGYDVVMHSLFLHHLEEGTAIDLLRDMAGKTQHLVVVNDLIRCLPGWLLAQFAGRVFTRSDVVRVDAVRSVEAGFTRTEAKELLAKAGMEGARITWHWPFRYRIVWTKSGACDAG